tara:strand:+ start:20601 stop:21200 length:600 start_codon:yes stop_codon:yes gene_type:complete
LELATTSIPFSSIGTGWQTFTVKDWNLSVTAGQTFRVLYEFDVDNVDPAVNSVPLRLDDGNGKQNVSHILTGTNSYVDMFADNDTGGQHGVWNKVIYGQPLITTNEGEQDVVKQFVLNQNYTNPFNPSTNTEFSLPEISQVSLSVFNTLGQQVATLVDTQLNSGSHSFIWNASESPSGIYFYSLQAGNFIQTNKMLLLK